MSFAAALCDCGFPARLTTHSGGVGIILFVVAQHSVRPLPACIAHISLCGLGNFLCKNPYLPNTMPGELPCMVQTVVSANRWDAFSGDMLRVLV